MVEHGLVAAKHKGRRCTRVPGFADVGDPFNSLNLMTLPHNGWDSFVWGFEALFPVDERFPKGHTPRKTPTKF